jgi:hypothetical protein
MTPRVDTDDDVLMALERDGWEALGTGVDEARAYYGQVLHAHPLMLLPGPLVVTGRAAVLDSLSGTPWSDYELLDVSVHQVRPDLAVVAYRARAVREQKEYRALIGSTYVREGTAWRLAIHQQTPI